MVPAMSAFDDPFHSTEDAKQDSHEVHKKIYNTAVYYLARREYAVFELTEKLSMKYSGSSGVKSVVEKLINENLLSDERFCESFVRYRVKQGKGFERINSELIQKRVSTEIINRYLYSDEYDWEKIAKEVYLKKFGVNSFDSYEEKSKRIRFMRYRGFSFEYIEPLVR